MISTWHGTKDVACMSLDNPVSENSPAMSFGHQSRLGSSVQGTVMQEMRHSSQDFSAGQVGSSNNAESTNMDKEAIILAPQMVSTVSSDDVQLD